MSVSIGQIIVWIIVGIFAGAVVGAVVKGKKEGYGRWKNFGIGLAGAAIGGLVFDLFNIHLGLPDLAITFDDLVAALLGSFLLLLTIWMIRRRKHGRRQPEIRAE